jgi:predicted nucleotidyltransferase
MKTTGAVDVLREALAPLADRIVLAFIFGSAARGTAGSKSDLDFLVIKAGRYNPRKVAGDIYLNLRGIARAVDLVVVTPQQVESGEAKSMIEAAL